MKQIIKKILPKPILDKAIQTRDSLQLLAQERQDFDFSSLRSSNAVNFQEIYSDDEIKGHDLILFCGLHLHFKKSLIWGLDTVIIDYESQ